MFYRCLLFCLVFLFGRIVDDASGLNIEIKKKQRDLRRRSHEEFTNSEKEDVLLKTRVRKEAEFFDAILANDSERVMFFVGIGIDPFSTTNINGKTGIELAACNGKGAALDTLLSFDDDKYKVIPAKGKKPLVRYEDSAMICAVAHNNYNIIRVLLNHLVSTEFSNKSMMQPLHIAAQHGFTESARILLRHGANPNVLNGDGRTPLHLATKKSHLSIIKLLLEYHAQVNVPEGKYHCYPIHILTCSNAEDLVLLKAIVDSGAESPTWVNVYDEKHMTPLHCAAARGKLKTTKFLLDSGALIDSLDKFGKTPLQHAVLYSKLEVVKTLLGRGADVNRSNSYGQTSLSLAARNGKVDMIKTLIAAGSVIDFDILDQNYSSFPLHESVKHGNLAAAQTLITLGAKINSVDQNGLTPLHVAVESNHFDSAKLLLIYKAPTEDTTPNNETPLMIASRVESIPIVQLLLSFGANPNYHIGSKSALSYACGKRNKGLYYVLIEGGATATQSKTKPCNI